MRYKMRRLFDDLGEYIPGFFKITISKELFEGIDWGNFTKEELATLVHEYVHFIQDISTTKGIRNFIYVSKILQLNFWYAHNNGCDILQLPINIEEIDESGAYIEGELQSFYNGNNEHIKVHHIIKVCREPEPLISELIEDTHPLHAINVYYDEKGYPYTFGADSISESMAYLVESERFGAEKRENEFPYNLCEMICEKIYPELLKKKFILVAMCELSLMHYHSGEMFWRILEKIKNDKLSFQSVTEFEKYFFRKTSFLYTDYCSDFESAIECIDFLYPKSVYRFKNINKRVKSFLNKGKDLRLKQKLFISELVENDNSIRTVNNWMNYFGIPLICDKNFNIFGSESDDMSLMLTPIVLYNFFCRRDSNKCDMEPFCTAQKYERFNYLICRNKPWDQVKNNELCPFGLYWHKYSLEGKSVIRKC